MNEILGTSGNGKRMHRVPRSAYSTTLEDDPWHSSQRDLLKPCDSIDSSTPAALRYRSFPLLSTRTHRQIPRYHCLITLTLKSISPSSAAFDRATLSTPFYPSALVHVSSVSTPLPTFMPPYIYAFSTPFHARPSDVTLPRFLSALHASV